MPLSKYFGGHGPEVMRDMKSKLGERAGESRFYATVNARKKAKKKPGLQRLRDGK